MTDKKEIGRNDRCPCGSGRKFKHCCDRKRHGLDRSSKVLLVALVGIVVAAVLLGLASIARDGGGAARPGQVWSAEHGHYHAP